MGTARRSIAIVYFYNTATTEVVISYPLAPVIAPALLSLLAPPSSPFSAPPFNFSCSFVFYLLVFDFFFLLAALPPLILSLLFSVVLAHVLAEVHIDLG